MSTTTKRVRKKRSAVKRAIVDLRTRLGHTQETFSRIMDVTTVSIGNWEGPSGPEPADITIARLASLANEHGHHDLLQIFNAELEEIGKKRRQRASALFDEIERWQNIGTYLTKLDEIDAGVRAAASLKEAQAAVEPMRDLLSALGKTLVEVKAWSWRSRR